MSAMILSQIEHGIFIKVSEKESLESFPKFVPHKVDLRNRWRGDVPSRPGWYLFQTDTPIDVLRKLPHTKEQKRAYKLGDRVARCEYLLRQGLLITPTPKSPMYIVYSGEAKNLKSRAREHSSANGTASLQLSLYPKLKKYQWKFFHLECDSVYEDGNGDKALRTLGEQTWRANNGWPVLCAQ